MALTKEQLAKLPPSVAALLQSQQGGDQQLPQQNDPSAPVMQGLQGALGRRYGETQDFDATADAELRGLMGQIPGLQGQFAKNRSRMGEDFTLTAEGLHKQNEKNRSTHLNQMANRGMGFSGANLVGQERIGEQFQQGVQGAHTAYSRGLEDVSTSEADAFRRIQERASQVEGSAAERARVRDETRKWQQEQQRMETERLAREQQQQQAQLEQERQQAEQYQQQLLALEQRSLASSQPMPGPTGSYARPAPAPTSNFNTDTNVSVNFMEYNLRDPNEIKALQTQLGLRADGIIGPQTISALQQQNAVYFDDRPIDLRSRTGGGGGSTPTFSGQMIGGGIVGRSGRK